VCVCPSQIYAKIAHRLTEFENYRTDADFQRALILKRLPFEFFDCFISLFWLAFWQQNVSRLRMELAGLFVTDCVRRVVVEAAMPAIVALWTNRSLKGKRAKLFGGKSMTNEEKELAELTLQVDWELSLDPVEQFDDWIELVVQFGYILFFAAVLPWAAFLALCTNCIELASDSAKIVTLQQRPWYKRESTIGIWAASLAFVSYVAVLSNVSLFGYTTNQLEELFLGYNVQSFVGGHVATSIAIIFALEHILMLAKWGTESLIPRMSASTALTLAKRHYTERTLRRAAH
jgi:Calcium-activated chloride channel